MEIRTDFNRRLREIQDDILIMGSMVEAAIITSIKALKERDIDIAKQLISDDALINRKRFEIEEKCIKLIATQQPLAGDLRTIISVLNILTELERIGDYAAGISKIVLMIGNEEHLKPLIDIPRMADKTTLMLRKSLDAFIKQDADKSQGGNCRG